MRLFAIAWKDTLVRFSSKMELLFFFILPVLFTFLLSGAGGGQAQKSQVLVVDEDGSELSQTLLAELQKTNDLVVRVASLDAAEALFQDRKAVVMLLVPVGFETGSVAGQPVTLDLRKVSGDASADAAERVIGSAVHSLSRMIEIARLSVIEAERVRSFNNPAERQAYFMDRLSAAQAMFAAAPNRVEWVQANTQGAPLDSRAQASVGQLVTWVLLPLLGTSVLFAYERNGKTLQRLLTTPTRKSTYLFGTISGQLAMALVQMMILISFGIYIMHVPWGRSPVGLLVMMVSFGLASVAMGVTLGTAIKTERQANALSIMIAQVMALLGGCWWPLELFPPAMKTVAKALPTYWAMQGFTELVLRGLSLKAILPPVGILLLFAVVFFLIGVRRFRYE